MAAFVQTEGSARKEKIISRIAQLHSIFQWGSETGGGGSLSEVQGFLWAPLSSSALVAGHDDSHTEKPLETGKVWPLSPYWGRRVEHPKEGTTLPNCIQ